MKKQRGIIFKKFMSFVVVFTLVSSILCIRAEAGPIDYIYSYKLQSGSVANLTYYIDTTANQALFSGAINDAISQWVSVTSQNSTYAKVKFTRVYSATGATIVFKAQGTFPSWVASGVNGYTELYSGSTLVTNQTNPPTANWTNCIVYLKTTMSPTTSTPQRTACHEIGHCLGLAHPFPPAGVTFTSIMYPSGSSIYAVDSPSSTDVSQIELIY